jgi:hypothetical protein
MCVPEKAHTIRSSQRILANKKELDLKFTLTLKMTFLMNQQNAYERFHPNFA